MPGPHSSLQLDIIGPAPLRPDVRRFGMFLITQPAASSPLWWLVFLAIAYAAARYAAWWCILVGYLATAIIIRIVDVCWIHYEMSRPGWDGTPDMDIVFAIGMFTRIGFVSLAMLPVSAAGIWLKRRHRLSHAHAIA